MTFGQLIESCDPTHDSKMYRRCLSQLGTGVAVITTSHENTLAGVTVNSFASVSLSPPLVLWSLNRTSRSYGVFSGCKKFAINVLGQDQIPVSRHFSSAVANKFESIATSF